MSFRRQIRLLSLTANQSPHPHSQIDPTHMPLSIQTYPPPHSLSCHNPPPPSCRSFSPPESRADCARHEGAVSPRTLRTVLRPPARASFGQVRLELAGVTALVCVPACAYFCLCAQLLVSHLKESVLSLEVSLLGE